MAWGGGEDRKWQSAARDPTVSPRKQKDVTRTEAEGFLGQKGKLCP